MKPGSAMTAELTSPLLSCSAACWRESFCSRQRKGWLVRHPSRLTGWVCRILSRWRAVNAGFRSMSRWAQNSSEVIVTSCILALRYARALLRILTRWTYAGPSSTPLLTISPQPHLVGEAVIARCYFSGSVSGVGFWSCSAASCGSLAEGMISGLGGLKMTSYETGSTHLEFSSSGSFLASNDVDD